MKDVAFVIAAALLVIGLVISGCAGGDGAEDTRPPDNCDYAVQPLVELMRASVLVADDSK